MRARARASPGNGRALRRRPPLSPSPAPASKARWLAATSGDVQGGALAFPTHAWQANTLSCSFSLSFHLSPILFSRPVVLPLAGCSVSWNVSCKRARIHLACMAEPCAGIDTRDVLERGAVGSKCLRTRGGADTQKHIHADGSVGGPKRERHSLTLMQSLFGRSESFPAPRSSACIGVGGPRGTGAGEGDTRRRRAFFPSILSTFPCFFEGCGTPVHARPAPSLGHGLPRRRERLHSPGGRRALALRLRSDMTPGLASRCRKRRSGRGRALRRRISHRRSVSSLYLQRRQQRSKTASGHEAERIACEPRWDGAAAVVTPKVKRGSVE